MTCLKACKHKITEDALRSSSCNQTEFCHEATVGSCRASLSHGSMMPLKKTQAARHCSCCGITLTGRDIPS
ncbi:MAG: hypothetical protein ACK55I_35530, partial [bacterium]